MKKSKNKFVSMPVINANAAGIDMKSKSYFTCVTQDNVLEFDVFTADLHLIAKHLKSNEVKTVAMCDIAWICICFIGIKLKKPINKLRKF